MLQGLCIDRHPCSTVIKLVDILFCGQLIMKRHKYRLVCIGTGRDTHPVNILLKVIAYIIRFEVHLPEELSKHAKHLLFCKPYLLRPGPLDILQKGSVLGHLFVAFPKSMTQGRKKSFRRRMISVRPCLHITQQQQMLVATLDYVQRRFQHIISIVSWNHELVRFQQLNTKS